MGNAVKTTINRFNLRPAPPEVCNINIEVCNILIEVCNILIIYGSEVSNPSSHPVVGTHPRCTGVPIKI
jgi:hypothetical protein